MADSKQLRDVSVSGMIYRFSERILAQLVSTIVTIILARLLMPEDYGIISLVTIFIQLCNILVSDGLSSSLLQKKDSDTLDFSSIFWASLALSVVLYFVVFFAAPIIASYYDMSQITLVLRIMALRIPLTAFNSVQSAFVSKNFLFKKFFYVTLIGTVVSGIVGVVLALNGAGIWALVAQYLTNTTVNTVTMFLSVRWRPMAKFSFLRFKKLFSFSWKVLVSGVLNELYESLRSLVIAKEYSSADLSYFTKGKQFPQLVGNNIGHTITNVMFPVFSTKQDDVDGLRRIVRRTNSIGFFVLCPIMIGFAACSETFVRLILTDKWLPSVPFIQVFCFQFILKPLKNISKSSTKAMGRSDIDLAINLMEKAVGISLVIAYVKKGTLALAITALITYIISTFINMMVNSRILKYSMLDQLADMLPYFCLSIVSVFPAYLMNDLQMNLVLKFMLQIFSGIVLYIGFAKLFRLKTFTYCWDIIADKLGKRRKT